MRNLRDDLHSGCAGSNDTNALDKSGQQMSLKQSFTERISQTRNVCFKPTEAP